MEPKDQDNVLNTQEKILQAARKVFHSKGYTGTRTRDIALEAGINLALLNYHYGSKEKLFRIVMIESMREFFRSVSEVVNDAGTHFTGKIELIAEKYINQLRDNPDIPIFVMHELRRDPLNLSKELGIREIIMQSLLMKQLNEEIAAGRIKPIHPVHFLMNLMGLCVFPFIASPLIRGLGDMDPEAFNSLMEERKSMIPHWIQSMLQNDINSDFHPKPNQYK